MSSSTDFGSGAPLPVGVIGCGRMGRLHARVYSQMPGVKLVGVADANPQSAEETARQYGCESFTDPRDLLSRVKAVTITVPTECHVAAAEPFLRAGIACLIEKPLAKDAADCRRIIELAAAGGAVVQVGHVERFNPIVRALFDLKWQPTYIEVVRVSPMSFRSIDVGVVLDMMIHDLDIVLKLANSPVAKVQAVGGNVVGTVEDVANAYITFASGCVASVTASRIAAATERRLRVFGNGAFASINYQKKQGAVVMRGANLPAVREAIARTRGGASVDLSGLTYADLLTVQPLEVEDVEPLRAELDAFVDAVTTGTTPQVTAEDGAAAVELAERIVHEIRPQTL
ncbi:MAG: Gfo/Idh/MocA family oxidoreductase [Tepidisphaeraceae bacterium]